MHMYDRDTARRMLEEELADPAYQQQFSGPLREAIDRLLRWLQQEALSIGGLQIPAGPLIVLLGIAAAVAVAILLVRPRLQRGDPARQPMDIEEGMTSQMLRQRADQHAAAGDYDAAACDRFRALVRSGEERGVLRRTAGRTATEIAAELTGVFGALDGDGHLGLSAAAAQFNLSRYGGHRLSRQDDEQMRRLDERLQSAQPISSADPGSPRLVVPQ